MRFVFIAVSYFILAFGTMSSSFGAGDTWTLKFECTTTESRIFEFEIKNITNIQSKINHRLLGGAVIQLDHNYKSPTAGLFEGVFTSVTHGSHRAWFQYDILHSSLKGWGKIGEHRTDCTITGKKAQTALIAKDVITEANFDRNKICFLALAPVDVEWDYSTVGGRDAIKEAKARGLSLQDCAQVLGRSSNKTLINTSDERSRITKNRMICLKALSKKNTWETLTFLQKYVDQAKARGFSERDCSRILGDTKVASKSAEKVRRHLYYDICNQALKINMMTWDTGNPYSRRKVKEARNLGLSEQHCARILNRKEKNVSLAATSAATLQVSTLSDAEVCRNAMGNDGKNWSAALGWVSYVDKAKSRGLSEQDCAKLLAGLNNVASSISKSAPQPSQALIKRTQGALKSLGLYRGKVDGVHGVESKLALTQWQKSADVIATGEIKAEQIARLESDAFKRLAKLQAIREEKALKEAKERAQKIEAENAKIAAEKKRITEQANKAKKAIQLRNRHSVAVIMGNRNYKGMANVDFAERDANAMRKFVVEQLHYREGNIIDLRNTSQAELRTTFGTASTHKGKLYDYVRPQKSDVIVFYSGHGVPGLRDKRGYLLPVDGEPNRAELSGYPLEVLLTNLSKVPARSMKVFIDACFSGDSPKGMLVRATSGLSVEIRQPKSVDNKMVVITASKGDQFASWDEDAKHGLFTKYLLEALGGHADKEEFGGNADGKVTLGEVKDYLDEEMTYQARRRFSRDQHATVSGDLKTVLSAY